MVITSLQTNASSPLTGSEASAGRAESRQALQAAKSVNQSGVLGANELVFMVDRQTHRPIFKLVDRNTQQVVSQIPPEYVLRLAQDLGSSLTQVMASDTDT